MKPIYACYLRRAETHKHMFVFVQPDHTGQVCVFTSSGIIGEEGKEKIYSGPSKQPPFATDAHAVGYAGAITRSKRDNGYTITWLSDMFVHNALTARPSVPIPTWFAGFFIGGPTILAASQQEQDATTTPTPKPRKPKTTEHDNDHPAFYNWKPRA